MSLPLDPGVVYATSFPALDAAIEEVSKFFETKTVQGDTVPNVIAALRMRLEKATGPLSAAAGRRPPLIPSHIYEPPHDLACASLLAGTAPPWPIPYI